MSRPSPKRRVGAGPVPRAPSHMTASSGPRTPGGGLRIPRPSRPPEREFEPARWDPSYFVPPGRAGKFVTFLPGAGMGGAGQDWTGVREGRRAESRAETRLLGPAQAPRSLVVPAEYPPGGEILLHAQQPLPQGLQHRRRRRVSSLRSQTAAAALAPRTCHPRVRTRAARPAPGRPSARRGPFRVSAPLAALAPPRAGRAAAVGRGKGAVLRSPPGKREARTPSPDQPRLSRFSL